MRREVVAQLQQDRRENVLAILSNGGYLQSTKGLEARKTEIKQINQHYDDVVDEIMDPGRAEREQRQLEDNPVFAAGMRGLERLKWDSGFGGAAQQQIAQLQEQGL